METFGDSSSFLSDRFWESNYSCVKSGASLTRVYLIRHFVHYNENKFIQGYIYSYQYRHRLAERIFEPQRDIFCGIFGKNSTDNDRTVSFLAPFLYLNVFKLLIKINDFF